ncbi:MAG: hypothetical protein ABI847_17625, partial [Anaerolineales bacterium]
MNPEPAPARSSSPRAPRRAFNPGDFVTTVAGYPVLYEVLSLEADNLVRVRGVNWAPGYTAIVRA